MNIEPLTREQSRQVDEIAIQQFGMLGLVLMENAGRGCADKLVELGIDGPVVIVCGKGNNGGDGFVIARHFDAKGLDVEVVLGCDASQLQGDAAANFEILKLTNVPIASADQLDDALAQADWVVDALLGTGTKGSPRPPLDHMIASMNNCNARKVAIDLPSGLDCDTGEASDTTFRAQHTFTFVAPKVGFDSPIAGEYTGQIHVMEIGVPRGVMEQICRS